MKITNTNKKNEVHIIFFHGIGDNYKNAQQGIEHLCISNELKVTAHAHKYPTAFQNYIIYATASFLFLGASVLAPITILLMNPITTGAIGLASLAALTCVFLSLSLLIIPFANRNQNLSKSSIEQIN